MLFFQRSTLLVLFASDAKMPFALCLSLCLSIYPHRISGITFMRSLICWYSYVCFVFVHCVSFGRRLLYWTISWNIISNEYSLWILVFFHLFCKFLMFTLFGSAKWMSVFTSRQWLEGTKDKNNNVALESILYQMIGRQSKNWLRSWRIVKESEREGLVQWGREREKDRERERERQVCKARAAIFARRWFLYLFIMQLMSVQ